jgi:hypothetical protein
LHGQSPFTSKLGYGDWRTLPFAKKTPLHPLSVEKKPDEFSYAIHGTAFFIFLKSK